MVSTRSARYKFSEGERVLCYEPDPTKAKVLYDSKVLEVIESKDKCGWRTVEYLIHFQGWNSSWDRCVSEDFVLKDTEENRQLQRDLAEKSQLQLGAYLYRRERNKKASTSSAGAGPAKRVRHGFSDDGSSSSTQPDEGETCDTDSSSGSASSSQPRSPPHATIGRAHIALPSALRDRLTFDYHLVVKRGRVSRLPAAPSAADILESFVQWFARAGAWQPPRALPRHEAAQRPDMHLVTCRLNLVREVADGLRVYFDFVLRGHLLYKQELAQYHRVCGQHIHLAEDQGELKSEGEEGEAPLSQEEEEAVEADAGAGAGAGAGAVEAAESDLKSPKMPEYSHLPPDPVDEDKSDASTPADSVGEPARSNGSGAGGAGGEPAPAPAARAGCLARRLRSHKSAVSHSENEEPAPSTSIGEPRIFETLSSSVGSSGSSLGEGWPRAAPAAAAGAAPTHSRTPLSLLLDKVAKWQIIPREGTEHLPCRVYGAIHLARLFVKLPEFLNATQMPAFKLKLILKHIDMFVQYLEEHSEWFGEMHYIADNVSRSQ